MAATHGECVRQVSNGTNLEERGDLVYNESRTVQIRECQIQQNDQRLPILQPAPRDSEPPAVRWHRTR